MHFLKALLPVFLLLQLSSCTREPFNPCPDGSGEVIEVELAPDFLVAPKHYIIGISATTNFPEAGGDYYVVRAEDNIFPRITFGQREDTLTIDYSDCVGDFQTLELDVYTNQMRSLTLYDSCQLNVSSYNKRSLELNMLDESGGELNIAIGYLSLYTESFKSLVLSGSCDSLLIESFGNSDVEADSLDFGLAEVLTWGEKDVYLGRGDSINAIINGKGNVYYYGNPGISRGGNGEGDLIKLD